MTQQLDRARSLLGTEKDRLEGLLGRIDEDNADDGGISQSGDVGADTTHAEEILGTRDGFKHQLEEVNAALQRLAAGTYGIDEVTGEPMSPARLEAEPTARTNIDT